jgi:hypothetical protein
VEGLELRKNPFLVVDILVWMEPYNLLAEVPVVSVEHMTLILEILEVPCMRELGHHKFALLV